MHDCLYSPSQGTKFGFKSFFFFESLHRVDAGAIEDACQTLWGNLRLGSRLWRHIAKGRKIPYAKEDIHKVFVTYSYKIPQLILDGSVVLNK